jgi:hypothetical protein
MKLVTRASLCISKPRRLEHVGSVDSVLAHIEGWSLKDKWVNQQVGTHRGSHALGIAAKREARPWLG